MAKFTYRVTSARTGKALVSGSSRTADDSFARVSAHVLTITGVRVVRDPDPVFPAPPRFFRGDVPVFVSIGIQPEG